MLSRLTLTQPNLINEDVINRQPLIHLPHPPMGHSTKLRYLDSYVFFMGMGYSSWLMNFLVQIPYRNTAQALICVCAIAKFLFMNSAELDNGAVVSNK